MLNDVMEAKKNIFLCVYKEMNHTRKMDYSPRPENNILPRVKEINVNSRMNYSSNTLKELRHIARQRGVVGYSKLRKADLIAVISGLKNTVNNSLMDAPVLIIETPILVPKPFVSRSTVGNSSLMDAPVPVIETPIPSLSLQGQQ